MWFILDGLGIALGVLTWGVLAFADFVVVRFVLVPWFWSARPRVAWLPLTDVGVLICLVYQVILGLAWLSHFRAMTADPGTVAVHSAPPDFANPRVCTLCKGRWKPPRAHHCKTCNRCIFRMDHHCPWINNCVGLGNQKLFILFLSYTELSALATLLILVSSAVGWFWDQQSWSEAAPVGSAAMICCGILAVVCLGAVLFVGDFLREQIESIQLNSTLVETYQRTHGAQTTFWEHFRGVFGLNWWVWPWPFPSAPPPDYAEPAIPDDPDVPSFMDDGESLGIAGEESEALASPETELMKPQAGNGDAGMRMRREAGRE